MAQNEKGGSDLDIFEGLGKKNPSVPPNGSRSAPPPPPPTAFTGTGKRTLLGVTAPPATQPMLQPSVPGSPSRQPPPPPGRATLPAVVAPPSPRPSPGFPAAPSSSTKPANANAAVDMDWEEEDEATHIFDETIETNESTKVFDEEDESEEATRVGDELAAAVVPQPSFTLPSASPNRGKATLLGLTASNASPVSLSTLPPPGRLGTRPPPPPASGPGGMPTGFPVNSSFPPPPAINPFPAALPTTPGLGLGQTGGSTGRTMPPMAPRYPTPIPRPAAIPDFGPSEPRRQMEATAMLRPPQNRTALFAALGVAGVVAIAGAVFFSPHPGRILINVTDAQGANVNHVEIYVDGRKQCDTAPCVVDQVSSGAHDVKILADGFEAPPVQTVPVESRKDATATFALASTGGTGIKVNGTQPGVKLFVDDKESGPLPQELRDLSPGDHVIRVAGSERYQPLEKHVSVERQKVQDLGTVTLKVLRGKATISLGTPGARVFLVSGNDRRELPMLPISVDIDTAKTWALEATKNGFTDYRQPIGFDDGQAEKSYVVALDARIGGVGGGGAAPPPLWNGGGGAPATYSAPAPRPAPAVPAPRPAPVAPSEGSGSGEADESFLTINSIPPSTAFLDGKSLGSTPKVHVSVKPGAHTVKFVDSEDGLTKTMTVTVGAGETKAAVAKLN